ncbi:MAG: hypothetical protein ACXITV_04700 [Luteibaculaceae bacterium]
MVEFIKDHPYYIPFILVNALIVYKVIKNVLKNERENPYESDKDEEEVS